MSSEPVITQPRPRRRLAWALRQSLIGIALLALLVTGGAWLTYNGIDVEQDAKAAAIAEAPRIGLAEVKSWGYQLQATDLAAVASRDHDLLVVDAELGGARDPEQLDRAVAELRARPGRPSRLMLAYLSIGEAEDYRPYWRRHWVRPLVSAAPAGPRPAGAAPAAGIPRPRMQPSAEAPSWLDRENPEWPRNYLVRYWDLDWQARLLGHAEAALDRILAAGFDGVYLDRADAFMAWRHERPEAGQDMIALIARLAAYARERRPGFLVVLQNAEELLEHTVLRETVDAVAKEDLLFGIEHAETPNAELEIGHSLKYLDKARRDGRPVFVVEYLADAAKARSARERLAKLGYIAYVGPRALDRLDRD